MTIIRSNIEALHKHEGFVLLCHKLRKVAPNIRDSTDLINCLKTLSLCEVDSKSRIVLTLLHLLKAKINELSIRDVSYLGFLLRKMPRSSLVRALQTALPIVYETQLETQLQLDNLGMMLEAFQYACMHHLTRDKIQFIVQGLFASDPSNWPVHSVLSALRSMDSIRNLSELGLDELLEVLLQRLATLVDQCKEEDLVHAMTVIKKSFTSYQNRGWYNLELCEKVAERVVREKWPLKSTSAISWTFGNFPFVHGEFFEYLSSLIVSCKSEASLIEPSYFLVPFSSISYKPANFEAMMKVLLSSPRLASITNISDVTNSMKNFT